MQNFVVAIVTVIFVLGCKSRPSKQVNVPHPVTSSFTFKAYGSLSGVVGDSQIYNAEGCGSANEGDITWDIDGTNKEGSPVEHRFNRTGSYVITATCTVGEEFQSQTLVTIITNPHTATPTTTPTTTHQSGETRDTGDKTELEPLPRYPQPPKRLSCFEKWRRLRRS